jgi:ABC-2 type transport system ATP-binding protein
MEEVEYLCNKVCIMDEGKIIASGSQDELVNMIQEKTQINVKLNRVDALIAEKLKEIKGVSDARISDDTVVLHGENADTLLAEIALKVSENGMRIQSIDVKKPNLEAVFLHLTGKALRD